MTPNAHGPWTPGPAHPQLADGAIHVWRADRSAVSPSLGELLSSDERQRAERFVDARHGELWRRSRGLLRALLGLYLERDPSSLRFLTGEHGKPAIIEDGGEPPRLSFNMSHSHELALYGFAHAGAIGVDVELRRRAIDEVAIAASALGAAAAQRLQELEPLARRREFLRAWARHEAELKCLGVGFGGVGGAGASGDVGASELARERLWVAELDVGPDAGGAVAAERPARELRCWDWQG
jgi:4'-phosphopantetheinyl transferase